MGHYFLDIQYHGGFLGRKDQHVNFYSYWLLFFVDVSFVILYVQEALTSFPCTLTIYKWASLFGRTVKGLWSPLVKLCSWYAFYIKVDKTFWANSSKIILI